MLRERAPSIWWFVRLAVVSLLLMGCNRVPPGRLSIDAVDVRGTDKLDVDDVTDAIATTATPKFLGLFRGVLFDYNTFDKNVLQRDLARVELAYRKKGYYEAHARAGRIHTIDAKHMKVEIVVEEGEAVSVRNVVVEGLDGLPPALADAARRAATTRLVKDKPFDEESFDKVVNAVRRSLSDRGYAYAKVKHDAQVDLVTHRADITLTVTHGEPCTFGKLTLEGLGELPEDRVRRVFALKEGSTFNEAELDDAGQALLDLGVFASVDIEPGLPEPPREDRLVPIHVKLEPARLKTLRLGGGLEFDVLKSDVHGVFGWENRNFLGGLRTLSINFKPGVVLYPLRFGNFHPPSKPLPEERLRIDFRQPGFLEPRTTGFIRPEFNIQGLYLDPDPPKDAKVLGYAEARNGIGLERSWKRFFASISHNTQVAYPFMYVGSRDPTLGMLQIFYPELTTQLDFRDNRIHPRKGILIGNDFQVAGYIFGGQASDIKVQPSVSVYFPLTRRIVVASRATVGMLFPSTYGDAVKNPQANAAPSEERTRDYQLTFFRGFFSGGPTSNRGYPLRGVGPTDLVPFISPEAATLAVNAECGKNTDGSINPETDCRTPTGGFTLWEASTELRINVNGPLSVATFCDASDVSPRQTDIRLEHLHLSCGAGGRYDTPVGPVRIDIGYRIPGMQVLSGLSREEKEPTNLVGLPIAVSLGIGEAF